MVENAAECVGRATGSCTETKTGSRNRGPITTKRSASIEDSFRLIRTHMLATLPESNRACNN